MLALLPFQKPLRSDDKKGIRYDPLLFQAALRPWALLVVELGGPFLAF